MHRAAVGKADAQHPRIAPVEHPEPPHALIHGVPGVGCAIDENLIAEKSPHVFEHRGIVGELESGVGFPIANDQRYVARAGGKPKLPVALGILDQKQSGKSFVNLLRRVIVRVGVIPAQRGILHDVEGDFVCFAGSDRLIRVAITGSGCQQSVPMQHEIL